jgi:hypothetical protein
MADAPQKSPVLPTLIIILGFAFLFFVMPSVMMWLATYSIWLAATFGVLSVLSFFALFWLRARHQRRS